MRVRDVNRTMGGAGATTQDGTPLLVRRRRDYPRVAVAMGNGSDPLLSTWVKSENNPVVWENPTMPCSFPGRVWQHTSADGKEQHWSMVRPSGFVHATRQRCWVCWVRAWFMCGAPWCLGSLVGRRHGGALLLEPFLMTSIFLHSRTRNLYSRVQMIANWFQLTS